MDACQKGVDNFVGLATGTTETSEIFLRELGALAQSVAVHILAHPFSHLCQNALRKRVGFVSYTPLK